MNQEQLLADINKELAQIKNEEKREKMREGLRRLKRRVEKEDKIITSEEMYKKLQAEMEADVYELSTGLDALDRISGDGVQEGELIVLSAPTKSGKTTFSQFMTHRFFEQGATSLWFSYENSMRDFFQKFGEDIPYFLMPNTLKGNSIDWVESKIAEAVGWHNCRVVFIDHLHYLADMNALGKGNTSTYLGSIMRRLKTMTKDYGVIIFLVAHLKKTTFDQTPELADLRDSSFIAQEADEVWTLWRKADKDEHGITYSNEVNLNVLANRTMKGDTGWVQLDFDVNLRKYTVTATNASN